MELDELEIFYRQAGAPGHGQPVARSYVRIAGIKVNLAPPARGQDGVRRARGGNLPGLLIEEIHTRAAIFPGKSQVAGGYQVNAHAMLKDGHPGHRPHAVQQQPLHFVARDVPAMQHPPAGMAAFAAQIVTAGFRWRQLGKLQSETLQFRNPRRPGGEDGFHHPPVAQPGAGHQRVVDMLLQAVIRSNHAGNPALGVIGVALRAVFLGQHSHPAVPAQVDGRHQPGDAAAHDQEIKIQDLHAHKRDREKLPRG